MDKEILISRLKAKPDLKLFTAEHVMECFEHYFDHSENQAAMINSAEEQLGSSRKTVAKNAEKFLLKHLQK